MALRRRKEESTGVSSSIQQDKSHNECHMFEKIGDIFANEAPSTPYDARTARTDSFSEEYNERQFSSPYSSILEICKHILYSEYFRIFSCSVLCLAWLYSKGFLWTCILYMCYVIGGAIIAALGLLLIPPSVIKYGIWLRKTARQQYAIWKGSEESHRRVTRTQRSRSIAPHHMKRPWTPSPYRRDSFLPTHAEGEAEDEEELEDETADFADAESESIKSLKSSSKSSSTGEESAHRRAPTYFADGRYGYPGEFEEPEQEGEIKPPADILLQRWQLPEPVSAELTYLTELVVKDFIDSWYTSSVSENPKDTKFPDYVRYTLANAMGTLCYNASQRNTLVSLLDSVSSAVQYHLHWFSVMRKRAHNKYPELFEECPSVEKGEQSLTSEGPATKPSNTATPNSSDVTVSELRRAPSTGMRSDSSLSTLRSFNEDMGNWSRGAGDTYSSNNQSTETDRNCASHNSLSYEEKQIKKQELIMNEFASTNVLHKCCNAEDFGCLGSASSPTMQKKTDEKQMAYLRNISNQLLMHLLPADEISSYGIQLILTEVLSSCVVNPLVNLVRPSVCNQVFVNFLRSTLQSGNQDDTTKQTLQPSHKPQQQRQQHRSGAQLRESLHKYNLGKHRREPARLVDVANISLGRKEESLVKKALRTCPSGSFALWECASNFYREFKEGDFVLSFVVNRQDRTRSHSFPAGDNDSCQRKDTSRKQICHVRLKIQKDMLVVPKNGTNLFKDWLTPNQRVCVSDFAESDMSLESAAGQFPQLLQYYLSEVPVEDCRSVESTLTKFQLKRIVGTGRNRSLSTSDTPLHTETLTRGKDSYLTQDKNAPELRYPKEYLPLCWSFRDLNDKDLFLLKSRYHPRTLSKSPLKRKPKVGMNSGRYLAASRYLTDAFLQVPHRRELVQKGILLPRLPRLSAAISKVKMKVPEKNQGILPTAVAFYEVQVEAEFNELERQDDPRVLDGDVGPLRPERHVVKWTKWIRYRDFLALHESIRDRLSTPKSQLQIFGGKDHWLTRRYSSLAKMFPPKQMHVFRNSDELVRSRQLALNEWLFRLSNDSIFGNFHEVVSFLLPSIRDMMRLPSHWENIVLRPYYRSRHYSWQVISKELGCRRGRIMSPYTANAQSNQLKTQDSDQSSDSKVSDAIPSSSPSRGTLKRANSDSKLSQLSEHHAKSPKGQQLATYDSSEKQDAQNRTKKREQNGVTPKELSRMEVSIFAVLSEMFDLSSQSWLRKNIISLSRTVIKLILAQSTIKKAVDFYSRATTPEKVSSILQWFRNTLWPKDTFAMPVAETHEHGPSEEEQWRVRRRLLKELQHNFPSALAGVIGKKGSQFGLKKVHEFLQCPVLLKSLTMTVLDCVLQQTFDDLDVYGTHLTLKNEAADQAKDGSTASETTKREGWSYKSVYNTLKGFVPSFKVRPRRGTIGLREILTHLPGAGPSSESESPPPSDQREDTSGDAFPMSSRKSASMGDSSTTKDSKSTSLFQRTVSRVKSFVAKK
eukprot:gb/GECG01016416.1/.p1 GENE.gb/GECG01016416.1/~~gb/GECG01016416.1/.p1  ORF type:complete len:1494 (+),score=191.11 gb/GECG01016416.1/:1-4482(+)